MSAHCRKGFRDSGPRHSWKNRPTTRAAAYAGLVTGAIAVSLISVPSAAQAETSSAEKLDELSAEHDDAVEVRDDLESQIDQVEAVIDAENDTIGDAFALIGTPTDTGGTLLSRLTDLSDLARLNGQAVGTASQTLTEAKTRKSQLDDRLADQDAVIADLEGRIDDVEAQIEAEEAAEAETAGEKAVDFAYDAIGIPYVFGAVGPGSYDCSGLTMAAWDAAGVSLPHYTVDQWNSTTAISRDELIPGDLVFYAGLGHVAIYVGGGEVIHAPQPGESVKLSDIDMMSPDGYRRVA